MSKTTVATRKQFMRKYVQRDVDSQNNSKSELKN